jgi:hypothetical protein
MQPFPDHPSMLEETECEVKMPADSRAATEFVAALEGKVSEISLRNIDDLRVLCSEFGFAELLSALEAFGAAHLHRSDSSIEDESRRRVCDVEEKTGNVSEISVLQQAVADL